MLFSSLFILGSQESDTVESQAVETGISLSPYARTGESSGKFTRLEVAQTGLDFATKVVPDHELSRLYHSGFVAGGIAIGDVNGDGKPDIFCAGSARPSRLYVQVGDMKFEDATDTSGMTDPSNPWSVGASLVDFDNDGDLDLYLCNYLSPNQLWLNDGSGHFEERGAEFGVDITDASLMAYFGDLDNDGWLDLYLLTNRIYNEEGWIKDFDMVRGPDNELQLEEQYSDYFKLVPRGEGKYRLTQKGREDYLFRNKNGKSFEDITQQANITGDGHGLSAVLWDYDQDNDLDIYVCNDFQDPDRLYENLGNGRFKDVIRDTFKHTSWFSMGSDIADVNNDGRTDLLTVDMSATNHYLSKVMMGSMSTHAYFLDTAEPRQYMRNFLHLNAGKTDSAPTHKPKPRFLETGQLSGISSTNWSWAPVMRDFDADGHVDLFVTNGHVRNFNNPDVGTDKTETQTKKTYWDIHKGEKPMPQVNKTFHNLDGTHFAPIGEKWGLDHLGISYAAAAGDLDGDGDVDLVVMNIDEPVSIFRNDIGKTNNLTVRLQGTRSNRSGIGAKVRVESPLGQQVAEFSPQRGYLSSHEPALHFGMGNHPTLQRLTVEWPSGAIQTYQNLPSNQVVTLTETSPPSKTAKAPTATPLFEQLDSMGIAKRDENNFDDFILQPLLPNKLSQLGPGIALGDLDQNGRDELYLAAPAGQPKSLHLLPAQPNSDEQLFFFGKPLETNKAIEEMAPLFFDADGDGDLDVYVVSGGVENGGNKELLRDQLLINQGALKFTAADVGALPDTRFSGSAVAAADYDRDGDLDLFLGGRLVEGAYPTTPPSMLLRNESSEQDRPKFVNATSDDSTGLQQPGMVTSALWSDVNADGWLDLMVCVEWGPVRIYLNQQGKLVESSEACGTAGRLGWWNGITAGDFDRDGDMDYIASNLGQNTKYHASIKKPSRIYFGRFGENETPSIIETKTTADCELPVRGKSCSQHAMPHLSNKFPTYHEFALAELTDIYTPDEIDSAEKFEVNELNSCILWNDGTGQFSFEPLPWMAQVAPSFGVVSLDANADGWRDVFLAQNFFTPQRETGRMAGGLGTLLLGNESGEFTPQWPHQSGIAIPNDAKGVVIGDFNDDLKPDLAVAINDQTPAFLLNRSTAFPHLVLELEGNKGNPQAIGAWVEVWTQDGQVQVLESHAGGGYLSQSTARLHAGLGDQTVEKILVRWPNGTTQEFPPPTSTAAPVLLKQSDK